MSHAETKYSLKPTAQRLIAVAFALCINVLLFCSVVALFAVDSGVSSGRVLA
jgi:hypothetical protein